MCVRSRGRPLAPSAKTPVGIFFFKSFINLRYRSKLDCTAHGPADGVEREKTRWLMYSS